MHLDAPRSTCGRSARSTSTALRVGDDFRWLAYVASSRQLGQYGSARVGDQAWIVGARHRLAAGRHGEVSDDTVDLQALDVALTPGYRATAEDHGIEVIEGARARRCRIAVDGTDVRRTRSRRSSASSGRRPPSLARPARLLGLPRRPARPDRGQRQRRGVSGSSRTRSTGTIDVRLTATERGRDTVIYPPDHDHGRGPRAGTRRSATASPGWPGSSRSCRRTRKASGTGTSRPGSGCPCGPSTAT